MNWVFGKILTLLFLCFLNEGNSRGILNCPQTSTAKTGVFENEDGSIRCLLWIPIPDVSAVDCQEIGHEEIHVFRVIGDYRLLTINCSSSANLFVDYDGHQPTEALSLNYFKNVTVTKESSGEADISLNSFGLTLTIRSIHELFQDYLSQIQLYKKQGYENEYFPKTNLSSAIVYPRTGKITIRGKGQHFQNGGSSLQFYFFFQEAEIRGKVSWIANGGTGRPVVRGQEIVVPCRPSHYVNHVHVSLILQPDAQERTSKGQSRDVNVTSEGTFDPTSGFRIPLTALAAHNLEGAQFKCSLQMAQGDTWMSIPSSSTRAISDTTVAPPSSKVNLPALYGLDRLNVSKETDAFSLYQAAVKNPATGDIFRTLSCTFNEVPDKNARVAFFSYGRQIRTVEEFKFRREFVLPIFAQLSYYVQMGTRIEGSREFVIRQEQNFGISFCTSGATYKYHEYTFGLAKGQYVLPYTAAWADLPYEIIGSSVFIELYMGKSAPKEIYENEQVTFVCKILKHVMVAPILWFTRTKDNLTTLVFQDDKFTEDVSHLSITLSLDVTEILCSSSIWVNNDLWHVASKNLTIAAKNRTTQDSFSSYTVPIWISVGVVILVLCLCVILLMYRQIRSRNAKQIFSMTEINEFRNGVSPQSNDYSLPLAQPYCIEYEIPEDQFQINKDEVLGSGEYGIVLKGEVKGQPVAVKTIKGEGGPISKDQVKSLMSEIKILGYLGSHPNLITLVGANTRNLRRGIVYVFVELCEHGNLLNYLKNNKEQFTDSNYMNLNADSWGTPKSLLDKWAVEIARGMQFLASKKVIHSDLAARNVLLTSEGTAKITDFGLSRQLYNYSLYMKQTQNPLPWRWMAVESLSELQFSCQSDVWSFGVVLWEMYSPGATPYPNMTWTNEFVQSLVQGHRLARPSLMSSQMYTELVLPCWEIQPDQRPDFDTIIHLLQQNPTSD